MSETPRRPYKGLVPYSEEDWPFFFGREREREIITNNLLASRLTLLYGLSGVGKSSVLGAGVTHHLRELAQKNNREIGAPEFAVVMFRSWQDDPLTRLSKLIERAVTQAVGKEFDPLPPSNSLSATINSWSERLDGDLLIVLDQFEDYFIYHREESGPGTFGVEFPHAVINPNLNVRFLISIREDALPKLDRFRLLIPNLFSNYIRIKHLDRKAARNAIKKPIHKYNELYREDGQQFSVEPRLVDAVLEQLEIHNDEQDSAFERTKKLPEAEAGIEAPYLQLVMDRIWDEEIKVHSPTLRLVTLSNLGGAKKIAREHVNRMMKELSWEERRIAANTFRFLSGDKRSFTASELAHRTELDEHKVSRLMEKLTGEGFRILHSSDSSTLNGDTPAASTSNATRYEIAHDMLGHPVENWWRSYAEKARLLKRLFQLAIAMAVISALVVGESVIMHGQLLQQRTLTAANVSSQLLAQLYQTILGGDDPEKTRGNLQGTLDALNKALNSYHQDNNKVGEGITLNNIAGIYRFLGEANRNAGIHQQAQDYYDEARERYQEAFDRLKDSLGPNHLEVAHTLNDLAYISVLEGKYSEAEPRFEKSRTILERSLRPDDRYLADSLRNLAECYYREGKFDKAQPLYDGALQIRRAKLEPDDLELVQSYYDLAELYFARGEYMRGEPLFNKALEIQETMAAPSVRARKLNSLACILYRQHKYAGAEQRFNEALEMWTSAGDSQSVGKAISLNGLAAVYSKQGKGSEAQKYFKQAQTVDQEATRQNSYFAAYDLYRLAFLYDDLGKPEAESVFKQVISIWENSLGRKHPDTAAGLSSLAFFYYRQGRRDDAESLFNEARSVQEALPYSPYLAQTLYGLAQMYTARGKYVEAEPLFAQALGIQERAIPEHPDFADTLDAYAELLTKTDRKGAADDMRKRAEQIRQIHSK